jgi:hypothetical protein
MGDVIGRDGDVVVVDPEEEGTEHRDQEQRMAVAGVPADQEQGEDRTWNDDAVTLPRTLNSDSGA